ncbi:MAG: DUF2207 domain-containing protein, partial [Clostridia bacterium]|nr:DUF2207 domain-containing protein [Clostridia bacterium]
AEVVGLQKYLSEFSLISERSIGEIAIWKEYLTYAVLFDIADRVMEQLKEIYPEQLPKLEQYQATVLTVNSYRRGMYLSAQKALQQKRMSGAGGKASFGGGGGFSGGGRGGGSR